MAPLAMAVLLWFGAGAPAEGAPQRSQRPVPAVQGQAGSKEPAQSSAGEPTDSADLLESFGVRIVSPTGAETVSGRVSVRAEVAADRPAAVAAVDFFIDGRLLFSDAEAPYELLWNSGRPAEHVIEVIAYGPGRQWVSDTMTTTLAPRDSSLAGFAARVERVEMHVSIDDDDLPAIDESPAFVVFEDGIEQPVVAVERVADLPLAVGLLIDHSESMFERLETALDAAGSFVEGLLTHPNDKVFVLGFADIPIVFQEFTNDSERLAESISLIDDGNYTALYDSIVAASRRFEGIDGRRAAILLTDGADSGSEATFREAVDAAQRADVVLYPVAVDVSVRHARDRWVMHELAERTGGRVFSLGRRTDPVEIYEAIKADLRGQFRVSYTPILPGGDGEWREIEILLRDDRAEERRVRTRAGYFAR